MVVWARLAEICNEYLKKGSPVFIEGRLQSRSWEAQDGTKRSSVEVIAQNVQFLPRAGQGAGQSRSGEGSAPTENVDDAIFEDTDSFPGSSSPSSMGAKGARGAGSLSADELKPDEDVPF